MTRVETAVLLQADLEQPLLAAEEQQGKHSRKAQHDEEPVYDDQLVADVWQYFLIVGWTLGFLLQCISLGATALMALHWEGAPAREDGFTFSDRILYWTAFGLSNAWLLLFPVVCVGIERSWRDSGVEFMQTHILAVQKPIFTQQTRRMTFVASVKFLMGVILGCFMIWGLVDMYLYAAPNLVLTLLASMAACLSLCYGMVFIYDFFAE